MAQLTTLKDKYLGKSIFSLSIGPSLVTLPLDRLHDRYSCGMKFIPERYFVPTFWVCLEQWGKVAASTWEHPTLIKFIPEELQHKGYPKPQPPDYKLFRAAPLQNVPNLFLFQLNERFRTNTFLSEYSFSWGCKRDEIDDLNIRGHRSIFLLLFKLYYYLGFRRIYLCGVDFKMTDKNPYCYTEEKSHKAVIQNNVLYDVLTKRLKALLPYFRDAGLEVFNCNPASHLTLFPFKDFNQCLLESESV